MIVRAVYHTYMCVLCARVYAACQSIHSISLLSLAFFSSLPLFAFIELSSACFPPVEVDWPGYGHNVIYCVIRWAAITPNDSRLCIIQFTLGSTFIDIIVRLLIIDRVFPENVGLRLACFKEQLQMCGTLNSELFGTHVQGMPIYRKLVNCIRDAKRIFRIPPASTLNDGNSKCHMAKYFAQIVGWSLRGGKCIEIAIVSLSQAPKFFKLTVCLWKALPFSRPPYPKG